MYLKLIGSILIILACSGYGFSKGKEYKKHIRELEELMRIISMFEIETVYSKLPIGELSQRISQKVEEPYKSWLQHLSGLLHNQFNVTLEHNWRIAAEELIVKLSLTESEAEELSSLGIQIGNYNIQMQENAFRWYSKTLEEKRNRLAKDVEEKQKLCNSLGLMTGIFLSILLI